MNPLRAIYFRVVAKGWDDNHQMSDMTNLPAGRYLTIEAGTTRSAAVDHDGTIRRGGKAWTGSQLPQGNGYTDIALGPDYGFVILEPASEIHVTGPITPGEPIECEEKKREDPDKYRLPLGSTIEHTDHGVTRFLRPDGTEMYWANDRDANMLLLPGQSHQYWSTYVIENVPSGSLIDESTPGTIQINDPINDQLTLKILDNYQTTQPGSSDQNAGRNLNPRSNPSIVTDAAPSWVIWAAHNYKSSTTDFGSYESEWIVPQIPDDHPFSYATMSDQTQSAFFNSVETVDTNGKTAGILQPVLAYNWVQRFAPDSIDYNEGWSAWIYDLGADGKHAISSTRITEITPGDTIKGKITYDGSDWTADLVLVKAKDGTSTPISLKRKHVTLDPRNVNTDVVYEAYLKANGLTQVSSTHEEKYFLKNVKFDKIVLKDHDGNVITNGFGAYANKKWWDYKTTECPHIGVDITDYGRLYYTIDLKTTA